MSEVIQFPESKIFVRLPIPPSANTMWRAYNGRNILSKKYREWRNLALCQVAAMCGGLRPMSGPVSVHITIKRPRKNADLDNRVKPVLDLLQAAALIDDDKDVHEVTARWDDMADGCEVTIQRFIPRG